MNRQHLRRIRKFYRDQWPVRLLRPEDELGDPLQIVTIRHARPDLERRPYYTAGEAQQFIRDYDEAGIHAFEHPSFVLREGEVSRIHTSTLPRAIRTAETLFGENFPIESSPLFIELEREMPVWPTGVRLPLRYWQVINRLHYFTGRPYTTIEPFAGARARTVRAAGLLSEAAARDGAAVLVAHGLFNFFLGRTLVRLGWHRVRRAGAGHLGVGVYVKE